ncbi:hypothetical protein [Rubinisphaera italica]|uniref:hypothetical protein n=1 Tax=Rubinisphaera italica TaxID=2527969 RepID=UPI0011B468E9|nr:hypothetical protein [Rubinisphaera italica]
MNKVASWDGLQEKKLYVSIALAICTFARLDGTAPTAAVPRVKWRTALILLFQLTSTHVGIADTVASISCGQAVSSMATSGFVVIVKREGFINNGVTDCVILTETGTAITLEFFFGLISLPVIFQRRKLRRT